MTASGGKGIFRQRTTRGGVFLAGQKYPMDQHFLQLRSRGCQGAWEVFQRAREMRLKAIFDRTGANNAPTPRPDLRLALYFAPGEESMEAAWRETARRLGATTLFLTGEGDSLAGALGAGASGADLLVVGGLAPDAVTELARLAPAPLINAGNETARPCRVLADLLAASLYRDPAATSLERLRMGWLGDADGINAGLVRSWLDAALCFHLELFLAFPQGHEPDADHLDFAMSAGAKIFLSYDPLPAVDGCHALAVAPWNSSARGLRPRHPLVSDTELVRAVAGIPVCSFDADVSPEADARWVADREACLQACQTAVVELMRPSTGDSVNVQQGDARSAATR